MCDDPVFTPRRPRGCLATLVALALAAALVAVALWEHTL